MRILVFCAHADDEVIGMGGTIARFAAAGAAIRLVMFSEGAEGYAAPGEKEHIVAVRDAETRRVCKLLGIGEFVNLHELDWNLRVDNANYHAVIDQIREFRPDAVFTHGCRDYHDHRAVARVVAEGWFHAPLACAMTGLPVWKSVPLYEFEVIQMMPDPDLVVDITAAFEIKMQAMNIYHSQTGVVGGADQMLEGRALARGHQIGVRYGEAFRRSAFRPRAIADVSAMLDS